MPHPANKVSKKPSTFDVEEAKRLRANGLSYDRIAKQLHTSFSTVYRALNPPSTNGDVPAVQSPTLPSVEPSYALPSAETVSDHETRLQVLESFVASLQAQALQPPVQQITVQNSAYALPSAETVQTWENPEDAKPERWNLWLPRGLKRRIDTLAKAAGIPSSTLVQRMLLASLPAGEGTGDA